MSHRPNDEREMARRVAELDWSPTPLGPSERWPASLRSAVRIVLTSRFAMWMAWGPELTFFYNDAYRATPSAPSTRGRSAGRRARCGRRSGRTSARGSTGAARPGRRRGTRSCCCSWSAAATPRRPTTRSPTARSPTTRARSPGCSASSPRRPSGSSASGGSRRCGTSAPARARGAPSRTARRVARSLGAQPADLPFALLYLFDDGATAGSPRARRSPDGHAAAPGDRRPRRPGRPVAVAARVAAAVESSDLEPASATCRAGPGTQPPREAVVLPLPQPGQAPTARVPRRRAQPVPPARRAATAASSSSLAGQIARRLANARAYEDERRRAEALAELDRAKTDVLPNVSHEFRTPLTLMLGPIEERSPTPTAAAARAPRQRSTSSTATRCGC